MRSVGEGVAILPDLKRSSRAQNRNSDVHLSGDAADPAERKHMAKKEIGHESKLTCRVQPRKCPVPAAPRTKLSNRRGREHHCRALSNDYEF